MNEEILKDLLDQYLTGAITEKGRSELMHLIEQPECREKIEMILEETFRAETFVSEEDSRLRDNIQQWLSSRIADAPLVKVHNAPGRSRPFRFWSYAAAAAVIAIAVAVWIFTNSPTKTNSGEPRELVAKDVSAPAINRATITLANGSTVFLDSAGNGQLALQGNMSIVKLTDGSIEYRSADATHAQELQYNSLFNPRGSKVIDMMLSDGSHVWLNSGSSIRFPIAFIGNERRIEVAGEAYFEVAHDPSKPFYVTSNQVTVQVAGTHFNVNAYSDEKDIRVTLLEGSVKVSNGHTSGVLKPGQQASIANDIRVTAADVDEVMSWKDGIFLLDNTDLPAILRQISRWYDVDVVYGGSLPDTKFGGGVSKDQPLSKILEVLQRHGLHFKLDGKTLIVN